MANFFKSFGKGLLYILLFPLIIAGVCIYGVVGIVIYLITFVKLVILFFTGRNLNSDLDEDIKAKAILNPQPKEEEEDEKEKDDLAMSVYPSDSIVYGPGNYASAVNDKKEEKSKQVVPNDAVFDNEEEVEKEEGVDEL